MDKKRIRKICLERRMSLSQAERESRSLIICKKLQTIIKEGPVFSYYSFREEVDISSFNFTHDVGYPFITGDRTMEAYVPKNGLFIKNGYGIPEPDISDAVRLDKQEIRYVIVPCVGFDEKRNRLGYGGGYYDTFLKDCKAVKIGVAFEIQKCPELISEDHDIPLDIIVTEENTY